MSSCVVVQFFCKSLRQLYEQLQKEETKARCGGRGKIQYEGYEGGLTRLEVFFYLLGFFVSHSRSYQMGKSREFGSSTVEGGG